MSVIHFIGGEKGGVGKSVFSRLLSQYFLDKSMFYSGLDADKSHGTLSRYYSEFTRPINLDKFESIDNIMELALEKEQQVLIDLPAQSQRFLDRWLEENDVLNMCEESDVQIYYWYLVDGGKDSVLLLEQFMENYARRLNSVVVKNRGCGEDFSDIEALINLNSQQTPLRQIFLPKLHPATLRKIDKLNMSFWSAANIKQGDCLSLMERQRTKVWMTKAFAAFDKLVSQKQNATELEY